MKSPIYKFLLANSVFDCIHIVVSQLRQFFKYKSFAGFLSYDFLELYFYTFISSITLLCSNLIKIAFSLERYFHYSSRKYVFFLTLNSNGFNSRAGIFLNMLAIFLDVGVLAFIVAINILLLIEINRKSKWIKNLMEQDSAYFYNENEISDMNENDFIEDEPTSISPSYTENSVNLEQSQDIKMRNLMITNSIKDTIIEIILDFKYDQNIFKAQFVKYIEAVC
ncbi:hypothetical protein BpHYR1_020703 [Brachionus plicatilis]|uniref:Uncharacterized protein n=1 Tax=Brachionus plicatilis TaxID=10195 RepID=A0A3M7Q089_BRAPC|nr:hypothetical protein BpHYR1_020703 [Brachionus plicatilis]